MWPLRSVIDDVDNFIWLYLSLSAQRGCHNSFSRNSVYQTKIISVKLETLEIDFILNCLIS